MQNQLLFNTQMKTTLNATLLVFTTFTWFKDVCAQRLAWSDKEYCPSRRVNPRRAKISQWEYFVTIQRIKFLQPFSLEQFSHVGNLLLPKLAQDRSGRMSALCLYCADLVNVMPSQCSPSTVFALGWQYRYISGLREALWEQECLPKNTIERP